MPTLDRLTILRRLQEMCQRAPRDYVRAEAYGRQVSDACFLREEHNLRREAEALLGLPEHEVAHLFVGYDDTDYYWAWDVLFEQVRRETTITVHVARALVRHTEHACQSIDVPNPNRTLAAQQLYRDAWPHLHETTRAVILWHAPWLAPDLQSEGLPSTPMPKLGAPVLDINWSDQQIVGRQHPIQAQPPRLTSDRHNVAGRQECLRYLGYPILDEDGVWGSASQLAYVCFQLDYESHADLGVFDDEALDFALTYFRYERHGGA